jgi:hypothetical protein
MPACRPGWGSMAAWLRAAAATARLGSCTAAWLQHGQAALKPVLDLCINHAAKQLHNQDRLCWRLA